MKWMLGSLLVFVGMMISATIVSVRRSQKKQREGNKSC